MSEQAPTEKAARLKTRNKFVTYVILTMLIASAAAWFVMPAMTKLPADFPAAKAEGLAKTAQTAVTWFKAFWVVIIIAGVGACVLSRTGMLDPFLPLLNVLLLVTGVGIVGLCLFSYYATISAAVSLDAIK